MAVIGSATVALCAFCLPVWCSAAAPKNDTPPPPEKEVVPAAKVRETRMSVARLRLQSAARELESLQRESPGATEAIAQLKGEIAAWREAAVAKPGPVEVTEVIGVVTRGHDGQKLEWGRQVLCVNQRWVVPPLKESLAAAKDTTGRFAVIRLARLWSDAPKDALGASSVALLLSVKPVAFKDIRAVAARAELPVKRIDGVPYRTDVDAWQIMPEGQTRSGPFYHVLGVAREAGAIEALRLHWASFEAVDLSGPGRDYSRRLYILSLERGSDDGHARVIEQARSHEGFHMGGGNLKPDLDRGP